MGIPDQPSPLHSTFNHDNDSIIRRNTQANDDVRRLDNIIEQSNRALADTSGEQLVSQMRNTIRGQKEIEMKERELNFIIRKQTDLKRAIREQRELASNTQ